jgi:hypothetical protein
MTNRMIVILAALTLAGCAEVVREQPWRGAAPKTEAEFELCKFDKEWTPTMIVRHHQPDGRLFFGDVKNPGAYVAKGWTTIRSAEAQPKDKVYSEKVRTDCYDEAKDVYYPCIQKYQIDLTEVGAIIRSNISDPADMAVRYCAEAARQAWKDKFGYSETNDSQICTVTVRAVCPLPGVPAETKTESED